MKTLTNLLSTTVLRLAPFVAIILPVHAAEVATFTLKTGDTLRVELLATNIFRVRLSPNGKFEPSLMERYGIVRTDWPACRFTRSDDGDVTRFSTAEGTLALRTSDGRMQLLDPKGKVLCDHILPLTSQPADAVGYQKRQAALASFFKGEKRKEGQIQIIGTPEEKKAVLPESMHEFDLPPATKCFGATFALQQGERFYGLGTASAKRIQLRGHAYRLWTQYRGNFGFDDAQSGWEQTEGPVPLLISTGGWGMFVNTTWVHYYDLGRYQADQAFLWGPGGQLDLFLLLGDTPAKLIQRYADITGKPRLLPLFGYGLTYVSQITQNEHEILNDSRLFRDRGIPCDLMGIEPQWMKVFYDASHQKQWNPDKFYMPEWMGTDSKYSTFIGGLERTGFKVSLWLNCNDDLTMEEERQATRREGRDKDFPAEPQAWFTHLQKFVRNGVRAFKVDPNALIEEHPERQYFNQRPDLENHNLTQIAIHKQMSQGYEQFTQQRAMVHYCGAYAGVQRWGATTMGDNGGGTKAMAWMLNYAMSGHMNTSCDMECSGSGLHFGFLQPWSQHNNWASATQPWFLGKQAEAMYRDYARLRYSLIPYIYSAAHIGHRTAMPILRPMPLVFPDDAKLADCLTQYMLGDYLLVAAFTDKIQLPAGRWINYWTGTEHHGPQEMANTHPANRAGGLFIKAGAIIPYWPEMDFVGEKPVEDLKLHVYPEGKSETMVFEDDGNSLDYAQGAVAVTAIRCEASAAQVKLTIEPRQGSYRGMPARRGFDVWIHCPQPKQVTVNGVEANWQYDAEGKAVHGPVVESPARDNPVVIQCEL
jgi:alpha-glucosidase